MSIDLRRHLRWWKALRKLCCFLINNFELINNGYFKYVLNMDKIRILILSLWCQDAIQLVIALSQRYQRSCRGIGIYNKLSFSAPSFFLLLLFLFLYTFLVETFSQKYDLYRLDKGPLEKSTLNVEDATYALKTMNYIRRMENRAAELYRQRLINGFLHLYVGQVDEN